MEEKMSLTNELRSHILDGESIIVEFKTATTAINNDTYDTISAFSNRDGGHIFLGVKDDGTILGINDENISRMTKNFATAINSADCINPPLYLKPVEYIITAKECGEAGIPHYDPNDKRNSIEKKKKRQEYHILYLYVPSTRQVIKHGTRIFDRSDETDIDITDNQELVYKLYARKQNAQFVAKVYPVYQWTDLREDLIDRARKMALARNSEHEWGKMTNEELVRTSGLISVDENTGKTGMTLAGILLFGTDAMIISTLSQYKTDAILRIINVDRYDDRDVIITNLIDAYERLFSFGKKHLNDKFVLEDSSDGAEGLNAVQSVSARDKILREIVSNIFAHRDYSSSYVSKMVIEKNKIIIENANIAHGHGNLDIHTFKPFPKNPLISKVFREIGLCDELGSGMRNTFKYTKKYSGAEPVFTEGDIFQIIIPLSPAATITAGPSMDNSQRNIVSINGVDIRLSVDEINELLGFCDTPKSRKEIQDFLDIKSRDYLRNYVLNPLIEGKLLDRTIPDKPNSPKQRYLRHT